MRPYLTVKQLSFFADHGYIGFENPPVDLAAIQKAIQSAVSGKKGLVRDLWRQSPSLQHIILRKIGPLALQLSRRKSIYLACDEWAPASEILDGKSAIQKRFSFQGLSCIVCLFFDGKSPSFFLQPSSWTSTVSGWPAEILEGSYWIAYGSPEALYISNPQDPHNHWLKRHGFGFGDSLQKNPLIS